MIPFSQPYLMGKETHYMKHEVMECDRDAETLMRLPMYYDLEIEDVERICNLISKWFDNL